MDRPIVIEIVAACMFVCMVYATVHVESYSAVCSSKSSGPLCNVTCVVDKYGTVISDIVRCDSKYTLSPVVTKGRYVMSIIGTTYVVLSNLIYICSYTLGYVLIRCILMCCRRTIKS